MIKTDSKSKLVKKMSEGWSPCPKRLFCGFYYIIVLLSYCYYIVFRICDVGSQFNNGTRKGKVLLTRQLNIYQVRKALLQIKLSQNTRGSVKSCNHWEKKKNNTAWKVFVFGFILVRIFPHLDWIRRDTLNTNTFYAVQARQIVGT